MAALKPKMTPALFHVLLALAEGPRHGYALLADVEARSRGRVELGPSSLYYSLGRLEEAGLIAESFAPASEDPDDPHEDQRRYYAITERGHAFLYEELGVLNGIVDHARAIGLAGETSP